MSLLIGQKKTKYYAVTTEYSEVEYVVKAVIVNASPEELLLVEYRSPGNTKNDQIWMLLSEWHTFR